MTHRPRTLNINGAKRELTFAPSRTLLEVLREDLGLTGTKFGCEMGECGLCTVLVDGLPRLSCLTLAALCEGRQITTIEGLAGKELELVEKAFAEIGASQCGYCTPSMVLMTTYLLRSRSGVNVRDALSGNLCRCTGYVKILEACEACQRSLALSREEPAADRR